MAEADRLCDRIAIVDHGKIIALDTPRGLRSHLPAEHGLELLADRDPAGAFDGLDWVERVEGQAAADRYTVRLYGESERAAATALDAAQAADLAVHELKVIEGTLEDVFVHLTGRELR
jgi:ABC-2 type transport system ATP-binding protein